MVGKILRRYLALMLALIISVSFGGALHLTASAPEGDPAAAVYVTALEGDVRVYRASLHRWVNAFPDMRLLAGDEVKTGRDSSAEITFGTAAVVHVEANTQLVINRDAFPTATAVSGSSAQPPEGRPTPVFQVRVGTVFIQVAKGLARLFDFSVETPAAIAGVRGTIFMVRVAPDGSTTVTVYNGVVAVRSGDQEVLVQPGETAVVDPGRPPKPPRRGLPGISDEKMTRWLEKRAANVRRQLDRLLREDTHSEDLPSEQAVVPPGGRGTDSHRERLERDLEEIENALEELRQVEVDVEVEIAVEDVTDLAETVQFTDEMAGSKQEHQAQLAKPDGQHDQSQPPGRGKDHPNDGKDSRTDAKLHDVGQDLKDTEQPLNDTEQFLNEIEHSLDAAGENLNEAIQDPGVSEGGGTGDAIL